MFKRRVRGSALWTPEALGRHLWQHASPLGFAEPLAQPAFDEMHAAATTLPTGDASRLHHAWHALVALAPDTEALERCLSAAPAGFTPVLRCAQPATADVLGSRAAWRVAAVTAHLSSSPASAHSCAHVVERILGPAPLHYAPMVLWTLADVLSSAQPQLLWSSFDAMAQQWNDALHTVFAEAEALATPASEHIQAVWTLLLRDPDVISKALSLRHAGAPGTLDELVVAASALQLA
jgi:hypothetical protein